MSCEGEGAIIVQDLSKPYPGCCEMCGIDNKKGKEITAFIN